MTIFEGITIFWLLFGIFFFAVGVLGIIRLPDAYSRLHASGKVATMGLLGVLLGVGFATPESALKLVVLGFFIAVAAPVTSHAIAKADKDYSVRQRSERDTSISAEGQQQDIAASHTMTTEAEITPEVTSTTTDAVSRPETHTKANDNAVQQPEAGASDAGSLAKPPTPADAASSDSTDADTDAEPTDAEAESKAE